MIIEPRRLPEVETRDDKLIAVALNSGSASLACCNRVTHAERWVWRNEVPPFEQREPPSRDISHAHRKGKAGACLSRDDLVRTSPHPDYTHFAFSVPDGDFAEISTRLREACKVWKDNSSEGASIYFLDPDGHKLEVHVGEIETRLAHYRSDPSKGVQVFVD